MEREHTGIFISDDEFSAYVYKKLKGKGIKVYPISFAPCSFVKPQIFQLGDIDEILGYLKKEGIKKLVFVGKVAAEAILGKVHPSSDIFLKGEEPLCGEGILKNLTDFLKKEDIDVLPLTDVLYDELAEKKLYTDIPLQMSEKRDIEMGVRFLRDIMKYRVGQSVVVKRGMIVAVEGIEGTDEMIKRAGRYCSSFVVVKMAGRYKDERFDMPVIGTHTIEVLSEAKGSVIAVEAGRTIIFNPSKTVSLCNKNSITLIGIEGE